MLLLVTLAVFGAQPSVALPNPTTMNVEKTAAEFYGELLAQNLERRGLKVVTSRHRRSARR